MLRDDLFPVVKVPLVCPFEFALRRLNRIVPT